MATRTTATTTTISLQGQDVIVAQLVKMKDYPIVFAQTIFVLMNCKYGVLITLPQMTKTACKGSFEPWLQSAV